MMLSQGDGKTYRIGIDLGGTNTAAGIVDENWRIVSRVSAPTPKSDTLRQIPETICACVKAALRKADADMSDCAGAGLGLPGICDADAGLVRYAHNLGWDGVPAAKLLETRLGLPVRIANDGDPIPESAQDQIFVASRASS